MCLSYGDHQAAANFFEESEQKIEPSNKEQLMMEQKQITRASTAHIPAKRMETPRPIALLSGEFHGCGHQK